MKKRNFSAEFKRDSAQLVLDQNYTVVAVASVMDVGLSTMTRWVKQLRDERQGKIPKASPITPEQIGVVSGKPPKFCGLLFLVIFRNLNYAISNTLSQSLHPFRKAKISRILQADVVHLHL